MRLRQNHRVKLSKDTTGRDSRYDKDLDDDEVTDDFKEGQSTVYSVPAAGSLVVSLSGLGTVHFLRVECDDEIGVALNGGAAITLKPRTGIVEGSIVPGQLALLGLVTSLVLTNPSLAAVAKVTVALGGV